MVEFLWKLPVVAPIRYDPFMELDFEVSFDLESRKSRTLIGSIEPKIKILI